jgi:hypothetical protein
MINRFLNADKRRSTQMKADEIEFFQGLNKAKLLRKLL